MSYTDKEYAEMAAQANAQGKILADVNGELVLQDPPPPTPEEMQAAFTDAIQAHLDAFAQTRNYDNIFTAATYATSKNPRFSVEGQYAVEARDATWAKAYEIMDEVLAGERPMPGLDDLPEILAELPELRWPE